MSGKILNHLVSQIFYDLDVKVFFSRNKMDGDQKRSGWWIESEALAEDGYLGKDFEHSLTRLLSESWRYREIAHVARELKKDDPERYQDFCDKMTVYDFPYLEYPEYDPQADLYAPSNEVLPSTWIKIFAMGVITGIAGSIIGVNLF